MSDVSKSSVHFSTKGIVTKIWVQASNVLHSMLSLQWLFICKPREIHQMKVTFWWICLAIWRCALLNACTHDTDVNTHVMQYYSRKHTSRVSEVCSTWLRSQCWNHCSASDTLSHFSNSSSTAHASCVALSFKTSDTYKEHLLIFYISIKLYNKN